MRRSGPPRTQGHHVIRSDQAGELVIYTHKALETFDRKVSVRGAFSPTSDLAVLYSSAVELVVQRQFAPLA